MVPVERLLLLLLQQLLRQLVMVKVHLAVTPVLHRHLRGGPAAAVPEVHAGPPAAPARAEEQRVQDGAGHELDDARGACLLEPWARGLPGCGAGAVGCRRRHRQGVHLLRQVVVTVRKLGEGLEGVLVGGAWAVGLGRGPSRRRVLGGAGTGLAVPQFDGWGVLGEGFCTTWRPPYRL